MNMHEYPQGDHKGTTGSLGASPWNNFIVGGTFIPCTVAIQLFSQVVVVVIIGEIVVVRGAAIGFRAQI